MSTGLNRLYSEELMSYYTNDVSGCSLLHQHPLAAQAALSFSISVHTHNLISVALHLLCHCGCDGNFFYYKSLCSGSNKDF